MMLPNAEDDARALGAFYARKLMRAPAERVGVDLTQKAQTARISIVADVVLHAYAVDSTPPVDTQAFIAAFKSGFFDTLKQAGKVADKT